MAEKKINYLYAVGRRKTAVARVRYFQNGDGTFEVNGMPMDKYFDTKDQQIASNAALKLADVLGQAKITVKVEGGGKTAQSISVRHGIARALLQVDPELRTLLKKAGYLTRDPRRKERKKPGLKRARRAPQWSKR